MSALNKIFRGLLVLIVVAVLALLIWRFAAGVYLYPGIIVAVLITAGVVFLVFRSHGAASPKTATGKNSPVAGKGDMAGPDSAASLDNPEFSDTDGEEDIDVIPVEPDITDVPPLVRTRMNAPFRSTTNFENKPDAAEVAARYINMNRMVDQDAEIKLTDAVDQKIAAEESDAEKASLLPPVPLIEDQSSLTEDDKNELVNAVWYRCENPYCKYTRFLSVHHIVDEKEGGTNRLDNLIVFCPYCHNLAHRHEIPDKEMHEWISNREERFKFKPQWRYY